MNFGIGSGCYHSELVSDYRIELVSENGSLIVSEIYVRRSLRPTSTAFDRRIEIGTLNEMRTWTESGNAYFRQD